MTRYFTDEHEWIEVDGSTATVGITDYAQGQLGDIVYVEVPVAGARVTKGSDAAVVESVKAASDVYAPVTGTVTEGNGALDGDPALVNSDPEGVEGQGSVHTPSTILRMVPLPEPRLREEQEID